MGNTVPRPIKNMLRWIALPAGLIIFLAGAVTFPLPLPTGLILMIIGLMVAAFNPLVLRWIKRTRPKFPVVNDKIRRVTPHAPGFLGRFLRRTDSGRANNARRPQE